MAVYALLYKFEEVLMLDERKFPLFNKRIQWNLFLFLISLNTTHLSLYFYNPVDP